MRKQCVVSRNTKCKHCFRGDCARKLLKDVKMGKPIGEGVQGLVVEASWHEKDIALKVEMLNVFPVSMTNRVNNFVCPKSQTIDAADYAKAVRSSKKNIARRSWINTSEDFAKELKVSKLLSDAQAGPHVYFSGICPNGLDTPQGVADVGVLAMERFDMTLNDFIGIILQDKEFRHNRVLEFLHILQDLRVLGQRASVVVQKHGDIHSENVVLKLPKKINLESVNRFKTRLIDFGLDFEKGSIIDEIEDFIQEMKEKLSKKLKKRHLLTRTFQDMLRE